MLPLPDDLDQRAWKLKEAPDTAALDELGDWGGPLIVSTPRTGSTLLGTIFLLLHDSGGGHVFDRYIHEPVAPMFWQDMPLSSLLEHTDGHLGPTDIIQESAYQFAAKDLALWFLRHARPPVAFMMRHPQLAWPSRWSIIMGEWLDSEPDGQDNDRIRDALDRNDFSDIGDILTTRVSQAGNGWYPFMSLIAACQEESIDFVIVDNARFREDPDAILGEMCRRWDLEYEDSMTTWESLEEAKPRVVMSDLAAGPEYDWYYAGTLGSTRGIVRVDRPLVPLDRFPAELRGTSDAHLTIDDAVAWYESLLALPNTL